MRNERRVEARRSPSAEELHEDLLGRVNIASRAEQMALVERYRATGDGLAAARLVESNLRLVVRIVRAYHPRKDQLEELIASGNLGLMEAIGRFDPARGVNFSSYAAHWIRARVLETIMALRCSVHVGSRAMRKLFWRLARARRELAAEGNVVEMAALAERTGVSEADIEQLAPLIDQLPVALDAPMGGGESSAPRVEMTIDGDALDPEDACSLVERDQAIATMSREFRNTLAQREVAIWDRRLVSDDATLLRDLGVELGVSKERVRQLEAGIKRRLRDWVIATEPDLAYA